MMLMLPSAAMAAKTTPRIVKAGTTTAYSGNFQAINLGDVYFAGNAPFIGVVDTLCQYTQLRGTVASGGSGTVNYVQIDDDGAGAACPNNQGGTTTITAISTNGNGQVYYDNDPNPGRDGVLEIAGNQPGVHLQAEIEMPLVTPDLQTCHYGLTSTTPTLELDLFNGTNPDRPDSGSSEAQGSAAGQEFHLMTSQTNSFYCPEAVAAYATVTVKGEQTANSGVFNQSLAVIQGP
ncbi:hypothetical protein HII36_48105 [Nonomuraea sp. NN258]|uniref:hypothetical protein n=1 Tax=Nonomuraea antri TaxID=2730852 RepID=UPI00156A23B8|nr:hypothetical protein [Nonomuraea antri]NRQ39543.1 hypothetical protein [Nonomuraea antri]